MIAKLVVINRIPVWIHARGSVDSLKQKLRHYILILNDDKCQGSLFVPENHEFADEIIKNCALYLR